jgi:predicted TIM-barrel fold metal-dependent hydrolase
LRIDIAAKMFSKSEPIVRDLPLLPSEYIRRQVRSTPFPEEPVDWIIEQAGEELFMFSSDYPHPEGGRDPLGKFEASLSGASEDTKNRFHSENFNSMFVGG